jgi:hypothetical protein
MEHMKLKETAFQRFYSRLLSILKFNLIRFRKIIELLKDRKLLPYLREVIYFNRKVLIINQNLADATDKKDFLLKKKIQFIEINPEIWAVSNYKFASKIRQVKADYYLKQGWKGHAIARGNEIVGDNWYCPYNQSQQMVKHPDVSALGIKMAEGHVYSFDTYLIPPERGNNVAPSFLSTAMYSLHQNGYTTAWAYVNSDNIAAVWNMKVVNKWRVFTTLKVSRFIHPKRFVTKD